MNKKTINLIQKRILALVPNGQGSLFEDSCSEASRLVCDWLNEISGQDSLSILKGENVFNKKKSHDVILIESDNKFFIIDPTIWQFFPEAKTILVYEGDSLDKGLEKLAQKYGGEWAISEKAGKISGKEKQEYLEIISNNAKENLTIN